MNGAAKSFGWPCLLVSPCALPLSAQEAGRTCRPLRRRLGRHCPAASVAAARDDPSCSELGDRTINFTAKAGAIRLSDAGSGAPLADVAYIAFLKDGEDAAKRPITFAVNGGPGAGSAWLDLGALGPWRLPLETASCRRRPPPATVPNAETWLDFTDLVFIDPPDTGYSRVLDKDVRARPSSASTAISTRCRSRSANGSPRTIGLRARNSSSAKAMAAFARRSSRAA